MMRVEWVREEDGSRTISVTFTTLGKVTTLL